MATTTAHEHPSLSQVFRAQPLPVWITAFAAVIAFMGIGLVDPILTSISESLGATPAQTTLLFSSYLGVQVIAMLLTGVAAYRFGPKRTLVAGLALIVLAAGLCAAASSIDQLVALRALWGLGNALFIATALSIIVGAASGGQQGAILLYEAALGIGLSVGPLVGAVLGSLSWRGPFAGTAILMGAALIMSALLLPRDHGERTPIRLRDPLLALRDRALLSTSIGAALYTAGFFTVLAWVPFILHRGPFFIGAIFFAWGIAVALSGVILAPRLAHRFGERHTTIGVVLVYALLLLTIAVGSTPVIIAAVVLSGLASGVLNTLFTGIAMSTTSSPRAVASAGYNFCRWAGGAIAATLVGHIAIWTGTDRAPMLVAAIACVAAALVLAYRESEVCDPDPREVPALATVAGAD
ncbi:MFS transporter [Lolliginicoccus levis]|uniref:MFS transporter n=1 Tax=Lolliginicoccus levis TaxID=2919542 RepID=UPI00241DFDBE|nr:MFS transporter [Lolliginicoccus levis]